VPAMSAIGRMMKCFLLSPRVRRLNWAQITVGAYTVASRFGEMIDGVGEAAARVAVGGSSLRDIVARLIAANRLTAAQLQALRAGRPLDRDASAFSFDSGGLTFAEMRKEHLASLQALGAVAAQPIDSTAVAAHELFGSLDAREWLATVAYNYEYYTRITERIMRSEVYRKAQGANW